MTSFVTANYDASKDQILDPNRAERRQIDVLSAELTALGFSVVSLQTDAVNATANYTALAAAISTSSRVLVSAQGGAGTVYINQMLLLPDNTELQIAPNTVLKLADNINTSMIRNSNHAATPAAVTGTVSYTTSTTEIYATIPLNNHGFVVGDPVALQGATDFGWNGAYLVRSVINANTFTVWLYATPAAANPTGTVTVVRGNKNITLSGEGEINANGTNQTVSGSPNTFGIVLLNVVSPTVRELKLTRGKKYILNMANCALSTVRDITLDTDSDGIHFQGSAWGAVVDNIGGRAFDDFIAFTGGDYSYYTQSIGDFAGIRVKNIYPQNCFYAVKFTGNDTHRYSDVVVEGIAGIVKHGAVFMQNDTDQVSPRIDSLTIRNVRVTSLDPSGWPLFSFKGPECRNLVIEDVWLNHANQKLLVIDIGTTCEKITVRRIKAPIAISVALVTVATTAVVNPVLIDDSFILVTSGSRLVEIVGTCTKIHVKDSILTGDTSTTAKLVYMQDNCSVAELIYEHCTVDGLHSLFDQNSAAANTGNVLLTRIIGGAIGKTAAINGVGFNERSTAGFVYHFDGPYFGTFAANVIQVNSTVTPGTNEIYGHIIGPRRSAKIVNKVAGAAAVYVNGPDLPADLAGIDRRVGDMCRNVNATANNGTDGAVPAGVYHCDSTASGGWKLLGTTGGANKQY